jgi:hypothetical protein
LLASAILRSAKLLIASREFEIKCKYKLYTDPISNPNPNPNPDPKSKIQNINTKYKYKYKTQK